MTPVFRTRHETVRFAAGLLCIAFIVIVLIKGLWILALFGVVVLAMQMINLALGPRRRRGLRPRPRRAAVARNEPLAAADAPGPVSGEPHAPPARQTPTRASEAARR
ncbi:hypothetical protein OM076_41925, partial [Solirubrobacter ginsenosidimutans]